MRYLFLILVCILIANTIHSQDLDFYTGGKIKDYDVESFRLFDQDSANLYSFRKFTNDYYLEIYSKDSLTRTIEIYLPLPNRDSIKYSLESLFIGKDTFQIFYSYFDEKSSLEKLEMVSFNKAGLKIGETKLIDSSSGKSHKKAGDFSIINRPAYNEFLSFGYRHSKDTTFINIDHFNNTGNKTKTQNFILDENSGHIVKSVLDSDCNLYHFLRSKLGNRHVKWSVRIYSPDTKNIKTIELVQPNINEIYLSNNCETYFNKNGVINFISTYALIPFAKYAEGIYRVQIDTKNHTLINESVIPFSDHNKNSSEENYFSLTS